MGWQLPQCFAQLLDGQLKKHAALEYVQARRLQETFALEEVTRALERAPRYSTDVILVARRKAPASTP